MTRINATPGNLVTQTIVLKNQDIGRNWNIAFSATKPMWHGLSLRTAYSYGEAKNTIDPGSTAGASWNSNPTPADPNNPGLGYSNANPGHRFFASLSYTKQYFEFGATSISGFWETRTLGNTSYIFAADANGDTGSSNDLIYIPRNTVGDELPDVHRQQHHVHGRPAGGGVRGLHRAGQVPERAPRRIRAARRRLACRCCTSSTSASRRTSSRTSRATATPASSASTSRTSATC